MDGFSLSDCKTYVTSPFPIQGSISVRSSCFSLVLNKSFLFFCMVILGSSNMFDSFFVLAVVVGVCAGMPPYTGGRDSYMRRKMMEEYLDEMPSYAMTREQRAMAEYLDEMEYPMMRGKPRGFPINIGGLPPKGNPFDIGGLPPSSKGNPIDNGRLPPPSKGNPINVPKLPKPPVKVQPPVAERPGKFPINRRYRMPSFEDFYERYMRESMFGGDYYPRSQRGYYYDF